MSRQNKADGARVFRISIVDNGTHEEVLTRKVTRAGLFAALSVAFVTLLAVVYCLVAFTPLRTTIPGYPDATTRNEAVRNAIRIDSLETIVTRWEFYADNLRRVVDGLEPVSLDSIPGRAARKYTDEDAVRYAGRDSLLRQTVREAEQFDLTDRQRDLRIEGRHFFTPLKGVVSQGYDPVLHPYVDITAPAGTVVKSVLDGTVIFADWSDDTGYTIGIQHSGDIVSIYKHAQQLLKKQGDKVTAGAPIALLGSSGALASGDHIHFELWYQGEPVDATGFISF